MHSFTPPCKDMEKYLKTRQTDRQESVGVVVVCGDGEVGVTRMMGTTTKTQQSTLDVSKILEVHAGDSCDKKPEKKTIRNSG